jgi:hypothetical protein
MKKILIDKNEGIAEVIDRIVGESADEVTVVIPKGSMLGRSPRNFHILKHEAEAVGKIVDVESVDETILALANDAGLGGGHPLLRRTGGSVSDIVSVSSERVSGETVVLQEKKDASKKRGGKVKSAGGDYPTAVHIEVNEESATSFHVEHSVDGGDGQNNENEEKADAAIPGESFFGNHRFFGNRSAIDDDDDAMPPRKLPWRGIGIGIGIALVVFIALFVTTEYFGKAQVAIDFQKMPWHYNSAFTGSISVSKADPSSSIIPAQVFTQNKNITQSFPASGSDTVSEKATGVLTIYNAYSSAAQTLVATTRFVTPSGKIFRLASQVIVPGAQITDGQIVPSSINAQVVADAAGPDYNIPATSKLVVPGFQGTPKYDGFYGTLASGTSGGFVGKKAVPTKQDIANAEASTTANLMGALQNIAGLTIPANFKVLDGATNITISKLSVSTSTDASGNFSVFGIATYRAIGFDEPSLKSYLLNVAQSTEASSSFNSLNLNYGSGTPDFANGKIVFSLSADGTLEPVFSADAFKASIAGKSIGDVRSMISSITNLMDGKISVWPVWLWRIPSDPAKIDVSVN